MPPPTSPTPPIRNILLLLADQQRQDCLGCYGHPVVRTPHIDRLAAEGLRFTHAFTPTAICTPARACLQTGRIARRHGLTFNWEFQKFRGGEWNLLPGVRLFSQSLAEAGWQLAHVGKWHIGDSNRPADYGYEGVFHPGYGYPSEHPHYLEYLRGVGVDGFRLSRHKTDPSGGTLYYALQEGPPEASIPSYLAWQTKEAIERFSAAGRPFFISCNFWGPHAPVRIPQPHFDLYAGAPIEPWPNFDCDLADKPDILRRQGQLFHTGWFTRENLPDLLARLLGYTTLIDSEIGGILRTLERCGELDRTLILYTSDHGSYDGAYRNWDKGYGMYDCLYRVPLIARHPSLRAGLSESFVSLLDLAPTFLEAAGLRPEEGLDGISLLPVLRGEREAVRPDCMVFEHYGHQIPFWQRMVRTRDAKYVYNPTDRDEFYDLRADPHEMVNRIDQVAADRIEPLKEALRQWMQDTNDPVRGFARNTL